MTPQEIEALKAELDALAARIQTAERVEKIFSETPELTFDDCLKLFADETRDVQADAVSKFAKYISDSGELNFGDANFVLSEAHGYAELIRQGGAE